MRRGLSPRGAVSADQAQYVTRRQRGLFQPSGRKERLHGGGEGRIDPKPCDAGLVSGQKENTFATKRGQVKLEFVAARPDRHSNLLLRQPMRGGCFQENIDQKSLLLRENSKL